MFDASYNTTVPGPPTAWPFPPRPQPWYPQPPAVSIPPPAPLGYAQQPLFPVQNVRPTVPSSAPPTLQPAQIAPPGLPTSAPPTSQPLFPVGGNNNIPAQNTPFSASLISTSIPPGSIVDTKASLDGNLGKTSRKVAPILQDLNFSRLGISHAKIINSCLLVAIVVVVFEDCYSLSIRNHVQINSKLDL